MNQEEEVNSMNSTGSRGTNNLAMILIPAAVLGIAAVAAILILTNKPTNQTQLAATNTVVESSNPTTVTAEYQDGSFSADGNYVSPGGPRDIDISITLANGIITDATFEGKATDPASKRFQGEFAEGFKAMVVGKNIDEVNLTKVAGSSLTPKGFNDALSKIKTQAKS